MAIASLGIIGTGVADGSDTITIPVEVDVVRSDPTLGASVVIVYCFALDNISGFEFLSASDTAPTDVTFYDTHLYTAGTNPWAQPLSGTPQIFRGLCLNPLTASSDSILVAANNPMNYTVAVAVAYTGVQVDNQPYPAYQVPNLPVSTWFDAGNILDPVGLVGSDPYSGGNPAAKVYIWGFTSDDGSVVEFFQPGLPTAPGAWTIQEGDIEVLFVASAIETTTDPGNFSPADGALTSLSSPFINISGDPTFPTPSWSLEVFEKTLSAPEVNDPVGGTWSTANNYNGSVGTGNPLLAGLGPIWADIPAGGVPTFNHRFRAID